jgi:chromosome segregation ATPase
MVEFDELLVTTGVDALVRLVKQRGTIELEEASKELKIPVDTLEDWARVLEEQGIISVRYKLTKVYLSWVVPTEAEIARERESFYKEKEELAKEIEKAKAKIKPEIESVSKLQDSFAQFYSKVYGKLDEMEKSLSPAVTARAVSEESFEKNLKKIDDSLAAIQVLKGNLDDLEKEVKKLEKSTSEAKSEVSYKKIKELEDEIAKMLSEMTGIKQKMAKETKAVTKGVKIPSMPELKKRFDLLSKGFNEIKRKNAELREDMRNLKESTEIAGTVGKELKGYEKKTSSMKKDLASLSKQADEMHKKSEEVNKKLKRNLDTIERFSESLEIAKTIVDKFPSQKKLAAELRELSKKEKEIEEKTLAVKKLLEMLGGKQLSAKQAVDLTKKVEENLSHLKYESQKLSKALESEKSTYVVFQSVKERIVPSLQKYNAEIQRLEKELEKIKEVSVSQQKELKKEAKRFTEGMKKGEIKNLVKFAQNIEEKKKSLDEIKESLGSLADMADNLNKRLVLLSREAKLLELRAGEGAPPAELREKEKVVRDQLKLTEKEELEFKKKREELKKLIKKLWEE